MSQFAKRNPGQTKFTQVASGAPADFAPVSQSDRAGVSGQFSQSTTGLQTLFQREIGVNHGGLQGSPALTIFVNQLQLPFVLLNLA